MQNLLALLVAEIDIHHAHVAAQFGIGEAAVAVRMPPRPVSGALGALCDRAVRRDVRVDEGDIAVVGLGLFRYEREDTLGAGTGHDDGVYLLGELVDVAGELLGHVQERHEDAHAERCTGNADIRDVCQQEHAADKRQSDVQDIADVADDGAEDVRVGVGAEAVVAECVVYLVEARKARIFVAEHLDDLLTVHHLLNIALGLGDGLLLAQEKARGTAADLLRNEDHCYYAEQQHQRHQDAVIQHDRKHAQHDRTSLNERGDRLRDELAERVDIVGVVAHDVAVLMGVEVFYRQILHSVEHLAAELVEEALRHIGHELAVQRHGQYRQHVQDDQRRDPRHYLGLGC